MRVSLYYNLISYLTSAACALHISNQQYQQVLNVLEREEERVELLRAVPEVQEEAIVNRLAQAPTRP